jgi:hypothetical protein
MGQRLYECGGISITETHNFGRDISSSPGIWNNTYDVK